VYKCNKSNEAIKPRLIVTTLLHHTIHIGQIVGFCEQGKEPPGPQKRVIRQHGELGKSML
jgi:hypothetical protein